MKKLEWTVDNSAHGMRLDLALVAADLGLSRRKIRAVIDVGGCYVNRKRVRIASRSVNAGDKIQLEFSDSGLKQAKKLSFPLTEADILYEDKQLVAINKPPGLPTQPMRHQAIMHVESSLRDFYKQKSATGPRLILVHRLDKETSGVLLVAKSSGCAERLGKLFRDRVIKKAYLAVTRNIPRHNQFTVECNLAPIDKKTGLVRVDPRGKSSLTHFKVLAVHRDANLALIACFPVTGRSHQLRVHLAEEGCPIIGDKKYGIVGGGSAVPTDVLEWAAAHHFLHAAALKIPGYHGPDSLEVRAPLPPNMAAACETLGWTGDILQPRFPD